MDLTSNHPFWAVRNGLMETYPPLLRDEACDVVVVGGGITGAIMAHRLTTMGLDVVLLDRRDVCTGSTSASTALLQYEIDVPLVSMIERLGPDAAARAYRLSVAAVDQLADLAGQADVDCSFERKTSLYLATDEEKASLLIAEAAARTSIGIDVSLVESDELRNRFHIDGVAGIVSKQAASCDPYRLAHGLLRRARSTGARIYDRVGVTGLDCRADGVRVRTDRPCGVTADHVVVATGYEAQTMLDEKVVDLRSTYAVVSQPLDSVEPWDAEWILWEAKDPYLYLRVTGDNRLLVGGEDDAFSDPDERDRRLPAKADTIREKVRRYLPDLQWEIDYRWAGTFGETKDGLAYIGSSPQYARTDFALGYGGNGITFSAIAADVIAAGLEGQPHPDADLFRFGR